MKPSRWLDPADRLRLESLVVEAERRTAGEIVVVVVHACDEYGAAGWRLGVALAALAFLAGALFAPQVTAPWLLGAQALALGAGHLLGRVDAVRRLLISEELVGRRVSERAQRAFAENGLSRTAGRTGILIFVTLLERRVLVLADEGIHRQLDPEESWEDVVALATAGMHEGRPAEGLAAAVRRCGEILARHCPAPPRNVDELPNAVVIQD